MKYITTLAVFILLSTYSFGQVTLVHPNGGEVWHVGKQPKILWKSTGASPLKFSYSTDNGNSWIVVQASYPSTMPYYKWTIPNTVSDQCLFKISLASDSTVFDISDSLFSIKPDNGSVIKIVVLGSSTAAGTGPTTVDSAWVWKYREYLFQRNTSTQVTNLAVGGYTTYQIMPDDYVSPAGRPSRVLGRNITAAVAASPNAIIINLPSNDAAKNYPVSEQVSNYKIVNDIAKKNNIPLWVATPQPRNFSQNQINLQLLMIDSTYSLYGDHTIDFWTGIATASGTINGLYDSGDGIHLNNAGHRILVSRVIDKKIFEQVTPVTSIAEISPSKLSFTLEQNYPNPFNPETIIKYTLSEPLYVSLKVFDMLGREVASLVNEEEQSGQHQVVFSTRQSEIKNLASGVYFYQLRAGNFLQTKKMVLLR